MNNIASYNNNTLDIDGVERARHYYTSSKADNTLRNYKSSWNIFEQYCQEGGFPALPATPESVAVFLSREADLGVKPATIALRVAAINHQHESAGHPSPTIHPIVKRVVAGIRRAKGVAPKPKAALTADKVAETLAQIDQTTLKGKRDAAVVALGFAAALRRSEIVALNVEDLQFTPEGIFVHIKRSKTDQTGAGHCVAVPLGARLRVVEITRTLVRSAGLTTGALFRRIRKGDRMTEDRLEAESVADLLKNYIGLAGFDAAAFAGHSLRSGFITSAAEKGVDAFRIMDVSRHQRVDTVRGYVRRANAFKGHAGAGFL